LCKSPSAIFVIMLQISRVHVPPEEASVSHSINLQYTQHTQASAVMRRRVTIKEIIIVVRLCMLSIWCWPLPKNATRFKTSCMKLYHCWCVIMEICLVLPLMYSLLNHFDDPVFLVKLLVLTSGSFHVISNFIFYQVNYHHIQVINIYLFNIKKFKWKLVKESHFPILFSITI